MVEALREVKAPEEVAAIRAAAALATEALAEVLPTVRVGQTEREVAARLEAALRVRGSEWHPFQTIVASGPRSALPHARTSERAVGGASGSCLTSAQSWTDTVPISPAPSWWAPRPTSASRMPMKSCAGRSAARASRCAPA
jgi:hypothetical protein